MTSASPRATIRPAAATTRGSSHPTTTRAASPPRTCATLHATKVFVLNDRSDYGRLTASIFEDEAKKLGLRVVGHDGWDRQARATSTS